MKISRITKYSIGIGAAFLLVLPLAASAKTVAPVSTVDAFRVAVQLPAGADQGAAVPKAEKVALRYRRIRSRRNRHATTSTTTTATNARGGSRVRSVPTTNVHTTTP